MSQNDYKTRNVESAWRSLTGGTEPPDDLMAWLRDVDTVVKYLGGDEGALRSTQVMALAIVLRWRLQESISAGAK